MRMLGSDAVLRSLEAEGVDVCFGIPGGAILPIYDAFARGSTVRHVLARHEQGAGHMAEGYARASGRVGVAMATSGPGRDQPRHADRGRVDGLDAARVRHRPGALAPDRHRRLPGMRHHRHHDPDREALVARPGRAGDPHVMKAAFHVARTGRCGPVLVDVPRDIQEARGRLQVPGRGRSPRLEAPEARPRQADQGRGGGDRGRREADPLRGRRHAERRRLLRAAGARATSAASPSSRR